MPPKVLIIHNVAWSHYKAAVFSELYKLLYQDGIELQVIQIALTEVGRVDLGGVDESLHQYPINILFRASFEETSLIGRTVKIAEAIRRYRPDIVILPGYSDLSYVIALLFSRLSGMRVIVAVDSTYFDRPRRWYKEKLKSLFIRLCDAGFCYGTRSKEYLVSLGMDEKNVFIRCQATPFETTERLHDEAKGRRDALIRQLGFKPLNFVYVGRLAHEKNITSLLKAYNFVLHSSQNASKWGLILVGEGKERPNLERMIKADNIEGVSFVGGKSWKEVPLYYSLSDLLILPSVSEPWGLVVNEAMICGLPVLVSNRCGSACDLVIEGGNGFTFDPLNWEELAQKMAAFVNDEVDRKAMGKLSRKIIDAYKPEEAALQMLRGIMQTI